MEKIPYLEDPLILEGLAKLRALPAGEERKAALQELRELTAERHPGLQQRMAGTVDEFFEALNPHRNTEDNEFLSSVDELSKQLDAEGKFPKLA